MDGTNDRAQVLGGAAAAGSTDCWGLAYLRHHPTTSPIELVSGTAAHSEGSLVNINNNGLDHWGRRQDDFAGQADSHWLLAPKNVVFEGSVVSESWFRVGEGE